MRVRPGRATLALCALYVHHALIVIAPRRRWSRQCPRCADFSAAVDMQSSPSELTLDLFFTAEPQPFVLERIAE
ncbi:MAG: hypothetical protein ABW217_17595 [Polyangiaceae bacterium]